VKTRVAILGAGSWGTALAIELSRSGHDVLLWGRDPEVAARIAADGRHPRRLTGYPIPPSTRVGADLGEAFAFGETILVAVPCASLRPLLELSPRGAGRGLRLVSTGKGIEPDTLKRMSEILAERYPEAAVAALSGPTFAEGVAKGDPTAAVIASKDAAAVEALQASLSSPTLRLYRSDDLVGVELAGALKNVVAIAAGIVSGLGFGPNTLAALVTRGLAEIGRIVRSQGGQDRTVQGLAGIGDLMLTCTGQQSRNRFVGEQVGMGRRLSEVLVELPEVAEGARTCLAVPRMAGAAGEEAPIAEAVVQVLYENVPPREAVERLMTRALRPE
jgi:glycerol-3-phosphate dehydrogenase (NAD(P)+)